MWNICFHTITNGIIGKKIINQTKKFSFKPDVFGRIANLMNEKDREKQEYPQKR